MRHKIENTLIYTLGIIIMLIGVAGLFLPFLQGVLLIALGLYVLSFRSPLARTILNKFLDRFPSIRKFTTAFRIRFKKFFTNQA